MFPNSNPELNPFQYRIQADREAQEGYIEELTEDDEEQYILELLKNTGDLTLEDYVAGNTEIFDPE